MTELDRLGSYENILAEFKKFDRNKDGCLAYDELHKLCSVLHHKWSESKTAKLMQEMDKDRSGLVSIEEFLGFIFKRPDAMGAGAGLSDYERVMAAFREADKDRSGGLNKQEFTKIMMGLNKGKMCWTPQHTEQIWPQVDTDNSGEVGTAELTTFIFGVPKARANAMKRRENLQKKVEAGRIGDEKRSEKEKRMGALVKLDIVCGPGAPETMVKGIEGTITNTFGEGKVKVKKTVDKHTKGIKHVSARDGAVVLWDRATMISYREDPFSTPELTHTFIGELCRRHIPRLLDGM